jgi:hypothetical protein
MMTNALHFNKIFTRCTEDYQRFQDTDHPLENPFAVGTLENLLYHKNWIDNVQWDLEDLIRAPEIDPGKALALKRRIDQSNQGRTDLVEKIDDVLLEKYASAIPLSGARLNTESVAWALDRLSILVLKIYHMTAQTRREDAGEYHRQKCEQKLAVLQMQQQDLIRAIDELQEDILSGKRVVKVYRQMKMYNDPTLNPVLYTAKKQP